MKKNVTEIIKVLIGTLIGTVMVIFVMWFLWGGGDVLFLPPWITIPILILLFVIAITIGLNLGIKPALIVIGSFVLGWWGFNPYYKYTCGPNSTDVKVMKPMAEKISNYIVKHGVPESLEDIPDLPYGLVGCEREVKYSKFNSNELINEKVDSKEKADFYHISEKCTFLYNATTYYIELDEGLSTNINDGGRGSIDIGNWESNTWASLGFSLNDTKEVIIGHSFSFVSSKIDGICNPLRQ